MARRLRAVGTVRVSRSKGDDARSPGDQRNRMELACDASGWDLVDVAEELDVSGGLPLAKRKGLLRGVEAIERGEADILIVAYLDRLVRSDKVQQEIVDRVEDAGGMVHTVDMGKLSNGTATQWLQGKIMGSMNEYYRRLTAEKTADAKRDAVGRGVAPFRHIPPGIRRRPADAELRPRALEQDPDVAPIIREAFQRRADGATIAAVRSFLADHGINKSYAAVCTMFTSRLYLGELRFGDDLVNEEAFPPIVDEHLFRRVQAVRVTKGRFAKSDRLLARLGVLRCGTCGSRMLVDTTRRPSGHVYYAYKCGSKDCTRKLSIAAKVAEAEVIRVTKELLAERHGEASADREVRAAELDLERAELERDSRVDALAGITGPAVKGKLAEAQEAVDVAADRLAELRAAVPAGREVVTVDDFDSFTTEQQRRLILLALERVDVAGADAGLAGAARLTVLARGQSGV